MGSLVKYLADDGSLFVFIINPEQRLSFTESVQSAPSPRKAYNLLGRVLSGGWCGSE